MESTNHLSGHLRVMPNLNKLDLSSVLGIELLLFEVYKVLTTVEFAYTHT